MEAEALSYMNALYNTALRMTRNEHDADDLIQDTYLKAFRFCHRFEPVIQDTYLKAFRFCHRFEPGSNMKAWLFKILTNTFINKYRKKKKEPRLVTYDESNPFLLYEKLNEQKLEPVERGGESKFLKDLVEDEIVNALGELPDDFRVAVLLSDLEGLSYQEIADMMGCPLGTVRSRLFRGRRLLQEKLWEYAIERGFVKETQE
jgi:RNA polymerase sigma-70 factor (ECF subfamily)